MIDHNSNGGREMAVSSEDLLKAAPLGTVAPSLIGGGWCRVERGWKWNGHMPRAQGSTFLRPGGDWSGALIYPSSS